MLYEGSTGLTEKQLQSVLKFPPKKSEVREKYKYLLEALQVKTYLLCAFYFKHCRFFRIIENTIF